MKAMRIAIVAIILLAFAAGISVYPRMPARMASHWNAQGEVDGYMTRFWGVFFLPFMLVGLALLLLLLPRIDPLRKNIAQFQAQYERFVVLALAFFLYVYLFTLAANLGWKVDIIRVLAPGMAILFYGVGVLVEHAKRNYFIGIRTPWTLASEEVWNRTHQAGGKWFKVAALFALGGVVWPQWGIWFIMVPVLLVALYTMVYSYLEYQ
ncbi:MAG: SdpI family protein, partial [Chloroflexi bacterium]|nr:SdpI family protein [Chloroflexota bacterium]